MRCSSKLALGVAVAAAIGAFPTRSTAQQGPLVEIREALEKLDANGDMTIDRDEVPESGRAAFDRLLERVDRNKNRKMEIEERRELFQKLRALADPAVVAERFKTLDKDADGKLARAEFPGPDPQFARLDANGDGTVTQEEFLKAQSAPPMPPATATTKPAMAESAANRRARILAMDKDGDGRISQAEWKGLPQVFPRLDADKDGFLSRDEVPKAPAS